MLRSLIMKCEAEECKGHEWDSESSPGLTTCKHCTVFKVHNAKLAMMNAIHPYIPVYYSSPIIPMLRGNSNDL
jgi:hypothetical protein